MKMHITSACSRQRTRCPFVCMLAGSHFRTQMANTCTAADAGVMPNMAILKFRSKECPFQYFRLSAMNVVISFKAM